MKTNTIETIRQLIAKLLCKVFGHKYTGDDEEYDNFPCERDCGYVNYNS